MIINHVFVLKVSLMVQIAQVQIFVNHVPMVVKLAMEKGQINVLLVHLILIPQSIIYKKVQTIVFWHVQKDSMDQKLLIHVGDVLINVKLVFFILCVLCKPGGLGVQRCHLGVHYVAVGLYLFNAHAHLLRVHVLVARELDHATLYLIQLPL